MRCTPCRTSAIADLAISTQAGWIGKHRHVVITLENRGDDPVPTWTLDVKAPGILAGIYGAVCNTTASHTLRVTGDGRTRCIPPRGTVSFGMLFE